MVFESTKDKNKWAILNDERTEVIGSLFTDATGTSLSYSGKLIPFNVKPGVNLLSAVEMYIEGEDVSGLLLDPDNRKAHRQEAHR